MNLRLKIIILWLLSFLTRWLWRLIVFVAIFVAVLVSAGRELAPLLHEHKTWLEANLTESTGEIVTMQQVDAHWEGLVPELAIKKLTVGNVLQVDSVLMRVDLLTSARSLALVFDRLDINHASVTIPVGASTVEPLFDVQAYLDFLFGSADIRVSNLEIMLQQNEKNQLALLVEELAVKNSRHSHWLNGAITVGKQNSVDKKKPVQVALKFDGAADNIFADHGRAHIDLGDAKNMALIWDFLHPLFDNGATTRVSGIDDAQGQLWFSWQHERIEWVSETSIRGLTLGAAKKYAVDFSGQLAGHILMQDGLGKEYYIHTAPEQEIIINRKSHPLPSVGVQYNNNNSFANDGLFSVDGDSNNLVKIFLPAFNLATLTQYLDLLPSKEVRGILKKLNPTGELKNVLVSFPLSGSANLQILSPLIQANLIKVSVSAWQGAPALTSVDGYLETSGNSGFLALDSRQGFSMHYKTLYRKPMHYDRAQGRVQWSAPSVGGHIYVGSSDLEFHADDGALRGSFWLDIPPAHSPQPPELYLAAGLIDAHVKDRNKYLPYTLSASLSHWLANSLKGGKMSESGFIYRGPLAKSEPQEQTLMFFSKVKNGRLQFDPAWPMLSDMDASVLVDNEEVHTRVKKARFLGFTLSQASADLKVSANKQGHFLSLQTKVSGPGNDILKVMRNTPLQKTFGNVFDGWRLEDDIKGLLNAGLRIGAADETEYQEIDLHLDGNNLLVGKIDLPLNQLSGDVHYSSVAGLSSTELSARLWGENQLINITPVADGNGLPDLAVSMTGNLDADAVAVWTQLAFVHFLKGSIPMAGTLFVPLDATLVEGPDARLSVKSELKGVAIDLPEPFKKMAAAKLPAILDVELWKDKQIYRVDYGDLMSARVEQNSEGKLKGDVVISQQEKLAMEAPDFLRIHANINQALLSEWLPVMDRHTAFVNADALRYKKQLPAPNDQADKPESNYPVFDLLIKQLSIGSLQLDDMKLLVDYRQNKAADSHWNIAFQNLMMAGNYRHYDDASRLPEADFDTVKLGEPKTYVEPEQEAEIDDSKRIDPLADVIPQNLPALRVHAKQVILKGDDVGDWRYILRPDQDGVTLDDLYVSIPGLTITGKEKDQGAKVHWRRAGNEMSTKIDARLDLTNQDGVEHLLGIKRMMEAEKTEVQLKASWNGSPAMLSFRRMQGNISFLAEKGRFLESNRSTDLMKVIAVLNFSEWARRLKLDFADVTKKGISFNKVTTQVTVDHGRVTFDQPMVMTGSSGRFELKGAIDSVQNRIDATMIVTIPVNNNAAWIAGFAAGLPVAAGVWVASKVFGDQIDKLSSINYSISGTLDKPVVKFVGLLPVLTKVDKDNKPIESKN